jgi:hypothetical protein
MASGSCSRDLFLTGTDDEGTSGRAIVVLTEKVGSAAPGICASTQLEVELVVVGVAAITAAIEVALALLIQLGGRVAPRRHGGSGRQVRGSSEGSGMTSRAATAAEDRAGGGLDIEGKRRGIKQGGRKRCSAGDLTL